VPISVIENDIRRAHRLRTSLESVTLDGDELILRFGHDERNAAAKDDTDSIACTTDAAGDRTSTHAPWPGNTVKKGATRRRRSSKRNRMKTRGWNIVTKMTNSHGQTVTIFEPFVAALRGKKMSKRERKGIVARILRDNGNRPGAVSIDYFLANTLEYLRKERPE